MTPEMTKSVARNFSRGYFQIFCVEKIFRIFFSKNTSILENIFLQHRGPGYEIESDTDSISTDDFHEWNITDYHTLHSESMMYIINKQALNNSNKIIASIKSKNI